jgi:hypothetical protein
MAKFTPPSGREHPPGGKTIGGQHGHGGTVSRGSVGSKKMPAPPSKSAPKMPKSSSPFG